MSSFRLLTFFLALSISISSFAQTPDRLTTLVCKLRNGTVRTTIDSVQFYYSGNRGGIPEYYINKFEPWTGTLQFGYNLAKYDSAINYITPKNRFRYSKYKTYDTANNIVSYITQEDTIRQEYFYTYDSLKRMKILNYFYYTGKSPAITLAISHKDSFVYNSNGQVIEEYINDVHFKYVLNSLKKYYYTGNLPDSVQQYYHNGTSYYYYRTDYYIYDVNGYLIENRSTGFSTVHYYKNNAAGMVLLDSVIGKKHIYTYSGTNKLLSILELYTSATTPNKYHYQSYDANDNLITLNTYGDWNGYTPDYRYVMSYNSNNLLSKMNYEQWNAGSSSWQPPVIDTERYFYYNGAPAGIKERKLSLNCSLFPNPASSFISLQLGNVSVGNKCVVAIYNTAGELKMQTSYDVTTDKFTIPTASLSNGAYFIRVKYRDEEIIKQFAIIR